MSRGTTFTLLRSYPAAFAPTQRWKLDEIVSKYDKRTEESGLLDGERYKDLPKHPKFIHLDPEARLDRDYIDSETGDLHFMAAEFTFNSRFQNVRDFLTEEFGLNAYVPAKSQLVVSAEMAREMLFAINYVMLGTYDKELERILDNRFIEPFGELYPKYFKWSFEQRFGKGPEDESFDEDDCTGILEDVKSILTVFLKSDNSEDMTLFIEIW